MIYLFDNSFPGLLTAVFEWFERKPGNVRIITAASHQPDAFIPALHIQSDATKAERVWKGMCKKLTKAWQRKFYCCYLSESPDAFQQLFDFTTYLFQHPAGAEENYGHPAVLAISKYAHSVEREKHRMEAFIRFKRTADGLFYANVEPDFNVLPLLAKHFKDRYTDQQWIIYDLKRNYGLFYDLKQVEEIVIENARQMFNGAEDKDDQNETLYSVLWKDYFQGTNIASRKNTKLHVKHIPRRYWRYLTEKIE